MGSGESYTATSGVFRFHWRAWFCTVLSSQASVSLRGCSITWAPTERLATHLEVSKEIIEPVKPTTAENTSSPTVSLGLALTPKILKIMLITTSTAILVAINKKMRFTSCPSVWFLLCVLLQAALKITLRLPEQNTAYCRKFKGYGTATKLQIYANSIHKPAYCCQLWRVNRGFRPAPTPPISDW